MTLIDEVLAPGRALELLSRRAARGQRPALRLLLQHAPTVIDAEERWLHPTLLRARPGAHRGAWRMAHDGEHEQMIELVGNVARGSAGRADPMFRALHGLLLAHVRTEREWLAAAIATHPTPDDPGFARYLAHCRPLLEAVAALSPPAAAATVADLAATTVVTPVTAVTATIVTDPATATLVATATPLAATTAVATAGPGVSSGTAAEPGRELAIDAANDAPIAAGSAAVAPATLVASPARLATGT